ncbi:sulfotransferase [Pseudoalteromonas sp. SMS1]|uniref:sulfotransferase n=1 Tax=Pseudoalteromonas sp. SMS1 TaxID=2908894 RepID=UPI001F18F085|nr:sulfotransferase [Pseudoalteromonas sp. SMS1]MCF2857408.1 sulfotransferase [Pseudoalteromonas sp. SMS1]
MAEYVFIGGVGRSGTSITRELLTKGEEVLGFPFEYRFIIDPDGIVDFIQSYTSAWSPYMADRKIKRLERFLKQLQSKSALKHFVGELIRSNAWLKKNINADSYHGWELEKHFPTYEVEVQRLIQDLTELTYRGSWAGAESFDIKHEIVYGRNFSEEALYTIFKGFLQRLFDGAFKLRNKSVLVEDNTWNLLFCRELSQLFDDAKFIHIYRDPRDVVASFCKQRWMPSDVVKSAIICRDLYVKILEQTASLNREQFLSMSLESLVNNKETNVDKLLEFAGVRRSNAMEQIKLSSSSFGRWRNQFSDAQITAIEPILKGVTEQLGYVWNE